MNEAELQPAVPKSRLRWYQYSRRALLLVITVLAAALSLLTWLYVRYGLELVGLAILVALTASLQAGCAVWLIEDARKRGRSSILLVALFAYLGPFGVIPWLVLRPRVNVLRPQGCCATTADDCVDDPGVG